MPYIGQPLNNVAIATQIMASLYGYAESCTDSPYIKSSGVGITIPGWGDGVWGTQMAFDYNGRAPSFRQYYGHGQTVNPWIQLATATPPEEIPLNLAEGWSGTANCFKTQECICVVELDIVKNTAVSSNEILATLPEGFRPSHARMYPAVVFAPHGSVAIAVHLTGEISIGDISGSPNARNIYATIVYKTAK